jgi:hypothetical protein
MHICLSGMSTNRCTPYRFIEIAASFVKRALLFPASGA